MLLLLLLFLFIIILLLLLLLLLLEDLVIILFRYRVLLEVLKGTKKMINGVNKLTNKRQCLIIFFRALLVCRLVVCSKLVFYFSCLFIFQLYIFVCLFYFRFSRCQDNRARKLKCVGIKLFQKKLVKVLLHIAYCILHTEARYVLWIMCK